MPERPPITGTGVIRAERVAGRLYEVEMENGYRVFGVVPKDGPTCPEHTNPVGVSVSASFSPYDLSRCRITGWLVG